MPSTLTIITMFLTMMLHAAPAAAQTTGSIAGTQAQNMDIITSEDLFRVEFRNAELKMAIRFLGKITNTNIVISEDIEGAINVTLDNITMMDALHSITKANELEYAVERGVIRIGKKEMFTASGEDLKTETIRLKYAVSLEIEGKVKKLLSARGSVLSDSRTNSIVVRETIANIDHIRQFIANIDVRDAQVLIEAKLVEATRDWSRNLGVQWGANMTGNTVNVTGITGVGTADSGRVLNTNLPALTPTSGVGLLVGAIGPNLNLDFQITAAETKGDLHVISEPSIVTSNGVPAHIRSGETIYVKTAGSVSIGGSSASGGDSGLEEIATGVEMDVTPHISVGEYVKMEIKAVTSAADFTRTVDGIPAIVDNEANTTVLVRNGETTVIGGLIRLRGQDAKSKVPFFGDIPLLGYLFKSRNRSKTNNELMIFIKPTIVKDRVASYMNNELPNVRTIKNDITLDDQSHLPKKTRYEGGIHRRRQSPTYRHGNRYESYRHNYGR